MDTIANMHAGFSPGQAPADPSLEQGRSELVALLERYTRDREGSRSTAVPGVMIYRIRCPAGPSHVVQTPAFAMIAQGSKRLLVGEEEFAYDPLHYMVSSVDLPVVGMVTAASPTEPYLGMRYEFDTEEIAALIRDENLPPIPPSDAARGLYVNRLSSELLDIVLRLLRLHETPADVPILAPMVKRELLYRLLMSGQGARLRQIALHDSQTQRVARAIRWLRENYAQPLRVEGLAREAHMSVSSLHQHFKTVTAMSPLQYQKQLRLQEARRLMFAGDRDVATVAHQVGYESSSQFSREYSRLFGAPPLRDRRRWLELGIDG